METNIYNIIQSLVNFILVILVIINAIIWGLWFIDRKYRTKGDYAVGPFLFSIHAFIFMLATFLNSLSYEIYFIWRGIVTTHAIILLICYGIIMKNKIRSM